MENEGQRRKSTAQATLTIVLETLASDQGLA